MKILNYITHFRSIAALTACLSSGFSQASVPEWTDVELTVASGDSSDGLASGDSLSVTQTGDELVCGIELESGGSIGSIAGSLYIALESPTGVAYLAGTLDSYSAIGLYSEDTGDSQGFSVDWSSVYMRTQMTGGSAGDIAYAVLLNSADASIDSAIGGTLFATNTDASAGDSIALAIWNGASVGDVSSTASLQAYNAGTGNSTVIQLEGSSSLGSLAGNIIASTDSGDALALSIGEGTSVGTISASIQSLSQSGSATGISSSSQDILSFGDGASIYTQVGSFVFASYGTAIENETYGIKLASLASSVSITGNINAGANELVFMSGDFDIAADSLSASSISLGSGSLTEMDVAQVSLSDSATLSATSLSFYLESSSDFSSLLISSGESVNLTAIEVINIYISDTLAAEGNIDLVLMDGSITGLSDSVSIQYILSDSYSASDLSAALNSSSNEFILSGTVQSIPEPSSISLSLIALGALLMRRRRGVWKTSIFA